MEKFWKINSLFNQIQLLKILDWLKFSKKKRILLNPEESIVKNSEKFIIKSNSVILSHYLIKFRISMKSGRIHS